MSRRIFVSQGSLNMGRNRNQRNLENLDEICKHDSYCLMKQLKEKETCYFNDARNCETYKFYKNQINKI